MITTHRVTPLDSTSYGTDLDRRQASHVPAVNVLEATVSNLCTLRSGTASSETIKVSVSVRHMFHLPQ